MSWKPLFFMIGAYTAVAFLAKEYAVRDNRKFIIGGALALASYYFLTKPR